jgi:hypothetical protein
MALYTFQAVRCAPTIQQPLIQAFNHLSPCPVFDLSAANKLLDENGWVK